MNSKVFPLISGFFRCFTLSANPLSQAPSVYPPSPSFPWLFFSRYLLPFSYRPFCLPFSSTYLFPHLRDPLKESVVLLCFFALHGVYPTPGYSTLLSLQSSPYSSFSSSFFVFHLNTPVRFFTYFRHPCFSLECNYVLSNLFFSLFFFLPLPVLPFFSSKELLCFFFSNLLNSRPDSWAFFPPGLLPSSLWFPPSSRGTLSSVFSWLAGLVFRFLLPRRHDPNPSLLRVLVTLFSCFPHDVPFFPTTLRTLFKSPRPGFAMGFSLLNFLCYPPLLR